jgi:hypothetical protein
MAAQTFLQAATNEKGMGKEMNDTFLKHYPNHPNTAPPIPHHASPTTHPANNGPIFPLNFFKIL